MGVGWIDNIYNNDGATQDVLNQIYTEAKAWAAIAAPVLSTVLKSRAGVSGAHPPARPGN